MTRFASFVFTAFAIGAVTYASPTKRDIGSTITDALDEVTTAVGTLSDTITGATSGAGGAVGSVTAIPAALTGVVTGLTAAAADIATTGPLSAADASTLLGDVESSVTTPLTTSLGALDAAAPSIEDVPVVGSVASTLISGDLGALSGAVNGFFSSMIANLPATAVGDAESQLGNIVSAINTAAGAF